MPVPVPTPCTLLRVRPLQSVVWTMELGILRADIAVMKLASLISLDTKVKASGVLHPPWLYTMDREKKSNNNTYVIFLIMGGGECAHPCAWVGLFHWDCVLNLIKTFDSKATAPDPKEKSTFCMIFLAEIFIILF